jgi:hypothetical protein
MAVGISMPSRYQIARTVTSYDLDTDTGGLSMISGSVPVNQAAACWLTETPNGASDEAPLSVGQHSVFYMKAFWKSVAHMSVEPRSPLASAVSCTDLSVANVLWKSVVQMSVEPAAATAAGPF